LARDARDLGREGVQLVDHRVDRFFQLEDLAADVDGDLLRQVAVGDGDGDVGDVAGLRREVPGHQIDVVGQVRPRSGDAGDDRLPPALPPADLLARDARDFRREGVQLVDHRIDGVFELEDLAADVDGDLLRQVAHSDRDRDIGDVADLSRKVAGHHVDRLGQVLPRSGDAGDDRLAAELAFGADLARDAPDLGREGVQVVVHRVDSGFQLEDLVADVDGDLLRQVAVGDGDGDLRDVTHLSGQVARHRVDGVGQVFPCAGDAGDDRLTAEL